MYDKHVISQLPIGSIPDVTITVQRPWFMKVAFKHNIWFPSGTTKYGLTLSKYVAYYETNQQGNANPKTITYELVSQTCSPKLAPTPLQLQPRGLWDRLICKLLTK